MESNQSTVIESCWMLSSVFFILSLGGLSNQESARKGNYFGIYGMTLAIVASLFTEYMTGTSLLKFFVSLALGAVIGIIMALRVEMINMPQLVACLHSFVGIAATVVGIGSYFQNTDNHLDLGTAHSVELYLGILIGTVTFIGSVVAYGKLQGTIRSTPLIIGGWFRHVLNALIVLSCIGLGVGYTFELEFLYLVIMIALSLFLGWHLIMAIGGADMPVVVSMLNSYSGWATSASGFMLGNAMLIIVGALVGSSGAILSYIMCKAMNRSFWSVIMGGFGTESAAPLQMVDKGGVMQEANLQEVVGELMQAKSIVIVPGYGMAVARCQEVVGQLAQELKRRGKICRFCIHPVAGRLPGHMNVLLAEANVPYSIVLEMDEINKDFAHTDVVLVVGANDIVNPDALENPYSVIAGMPVCEVWKAKRVFVIKRSTARGYAAIDNPLFTKPNTKMFYGDAKARIVDVLNEITKGSSSNIIGTKSKNEAELMNAISSDREDEDLSSYLAKCVREIAVPKEVWSQEKRVAITPSACKRLIKLGFRVKVEKYAGHAAGFNDEAYKKAGAIIVSTKEIWENSELIVKIRPPADNFLLGYHEAESLQKTKILISYIYPGQNKPLVEMLLSKSQLTVLAHDCVPRITRAQKLDTLSSTANLNGYRAVLEAFAEFPRFSKAIITAAGKVAPAKVLIMGAGVAGLAAIGMAKGMGAEVRAFDARSAAKEQVESLGAEFLEVEYKEEGAGVGGYAKEMSEGYKNAQRRMIQKQAREVDVIITTALIPGKRAPILIDTETVRMMKPNSVIVDLASEMGGNCELTKPGEKFIDPESRTIIIGYIDMPSRMAQQASELFAANMINLFEELCSVPKNSKNNASNFTLDFQDEIVKGLTVIRNGTLLWSLPLPPPVSNTSNQAQNTQSQSSTTVFNQNLKQALIDPKENQRDLEQGPRESHSERHGAARASSSPFRDSLVTSIFLIVLFLVIGIATDKAYTVLTAIFIFLLSIFIGYMVIWNVTPALHTPLMSVTNAISGIIIVGCMYLLDSPGFFETYSVFGMIGVLFASINIFGGFIVTQRMLNMFKNA